MVDELSSTECAEYREEAARDLKQAYYRIERALSSDRSVNYLVSDGGFKKCVELTTVEHHGRARIQRALEA